MANGKVSYAANVPFTEIGNTGVYYEVVNGVVIISTDNPIKVSIPDRSATIIGRLPDNIRKPTREVRGPASYSPDAWTCGSMRVTTDGDIVFYHRNGSATNWLSGHISY